MDIIERDLTYPELEQVHVGFDAHQRSHGNAMPPRTRRSFVAMDGNDFVGCATGLRDNKWYYLSDLWIADDYRGRGIGRQLLAMWEQRVASEGVVNVYTWTAGFQAPGFYAKQGWSVFAELADFYQNGCDRFGLTKALTADSFAVRAARADLSAFDRLMSRSGGEPPRPGDEMAS